jgi:hypothetical protein
VDDHEATLAPTPPTTHAPVHVKMGKFIRVP